MLPTNLKTLTREQIVETLLEIEPVTSDDFLKIRETLTRIGIPNKNCDTLFQSCHILHKKGRYFIILFLELFGLDGRVVELTEEDYARRNMIAKALEKWGLCKIKKVTNSEAVLPEGAHSFTIIQHKDKANVKLVAKYTMMGAKDAFSNSQK